MALDTGSIRKMADLDRLLWFQTDAGGDIALRPDTGLPSIIDVHSHIGWSYGFSRRIDHEARRPFAYFFDYSYDQEFLTAEEHPLKAEGEAVEIAARQSIIRRPPLCAGHTAANFADEMDRFNYRHACLMPIEPPFHTRGAAEVLDAARLDPRFLPFAAIHPWPWSGRKEARLKALIERGARGLKFHPEFQFIAPDNPHAMKLFECCEAHHVLVLGHSGHTGAEPAWLRRKSEPDRYRRALEAFPKLRLILGHTGLTRHREALRLARDFEDQVWVDLSGLVRDEIRMVLDQYSREKILFASDWPFYPIAIALARLLVATEDCPECRGALLHDNAARLLGGQA